MPSRTIDQGPILRLFEVRAKAGCAEDLLEKFSTTSAAVVDQQPGNKGYFFGRGALHDDETVVFASMWESLASVQQRFGAEWQTSFLPPGYMDLIEECTVRHLDLSSGWHVNLDR